MTIDTIPIRGGQYVRAGGQTCTVTGFAGVMFDTAQLLHPDGTTEAVRVLDFIRVWKPKT